MCAQIEETAGQLNRCELQTTILIIHDWVVVEHESITCVLDTPPAAMPDQVENVKQLLSDHDEEHGSSGSETEGYEAESQTESCSSDEGDGDLSATLYSPIHTITFKAMGTTKIHGAQDILLAARDVLDHGENVPVELILEPDNPKDNREIAFQCFLNDRWHKFGYVVSELLDEVHTAISLHEIISTTFKRIKYVFTWTKCDHGFYAAINITKKGCWSSQAVKHASTF